MSVKKSKTVSEEELLKSLNELEENAISKGSKDEDSDDDEESSSEEESSEESSSAKKSQADEEDEEEAEEEDEDEVEKGEKAIPDQWRNKKAVNGGFGKEATREGKGSESFEMNAEENDLTRRTAKSIMKSNEGVKKGIEVSEFLEGMVDSMVEATDDMHKSLVESTADQKSFNMKIAKGLVLLNEKLDRILDQQEELGDEPVTRVSKSGNMAKSQLGVVERFAPANTTHSKDDVLKALTLLSSEGSIPAVAVATYESSDELPPEYRQMVQRKLMAG